MSEWMTIGELSDYLKFPEGKIRDLVKQKSIPFSMRLGSLRFPKSEIDQWMMTPPGGNGSSPLNDTSLVYRGKPIKDYTLAASKILLSAAPWGRLTDFLRKAITLADDVKRAYPHLNEFKHLMPNAYDYVRVCFQLGLLDKEREGRRVHYSPTEYAHRLRRASAGEVEKAIILKSILNLVKNGLELIPDERHAIFLLWYGLKLKARGDVPNESFFSKEGEDTHYPKIRFMFSRSLCDFLFGGSASREQEFLGQWEKFLKPEPND